ncbi:MAG: hypothetical protein AAFQ14_17310 [Cyanobacteria bacterium J06621_12]
MFSQIYPFSHLLIAICELLLAVWSIRLWFKSKSVAAIVLLVLLLGISYDNLLLATGRLIGAGELLKSLSQVRFLVHHLVVPFLIVVGVELAHRLGAAWANKFTRSLAWILSISLGIIDIFKRYIGAQLEPIYFAGVLRYTASFSGGLPIITIAVTLFVLIIGIGIWLRSGKVWYWLFIGTLIALIVNAFPLSLVGTLPGSIAEFFMTLTLLLTERYIQHQPATDLPNSPVLDRV